eukprot:3932750-Rhodomonas_salina.1
MTLRAPYAPMPVTDAILSYAATPMPWRLLYWAAICCYARAMHVPYSDTLCCYGRAMPCAVLG